MPPRSFAYQKQKSTNTSINELSMVISSERRAHSKVVVLSLDISKTYDCVNLKSKDINTV